MTPEQQDSLTIITVIKDDLPGFLRTAESVASQINQEFEWLIIDGSNPPLDSKVLEPFSLKCDVKIIVSKPLGIYNAMNRGINEASNEWLWFLNGGDILLGNSAVKTAMSCIDNVQREVLIASPVLHLSKSGFVFSLTIPHCRLIDGYKVADFHHQGVLVQKMAAISIGSFDEELKFAADGKFLDAIIQDYQFSITPIPLAGFYLGGRSLTKFFKTIKEADSYRPRVSSSNVQYLQSFKSKIRLAMLFFESNPVIYPFLRIYLSRREKKFLNQIESGIL
jgi:glycosyltransferase involved in cell wall biosynthesis